MGSETPLVGRAAELQQLFTAAQQARAGNPSALLVHGEPGVGKTRLVTEVAAQLEVDGFRVHWGKCMRFAAESSSFLPIVQAFGPDLDLVATDAGTSALQRVGAALDAGVKASPFALIIDDIQWADASSLDVLAYIVAGFRRGQPLLLLGTYRDTELAAGHRLHGWLADMRRMPGLSLLPLVRLDRHDTSLLVESILGEPPSTIMEDAFQRSNGNPYMVELLLENLEPPSDRAPDSLPTDLREALLAAWHRTSASTRALMQVLAIGGRPVDINVLEQVSATVDLTPDMVEEGVAEGEAAGMVTRGQDGSIWFRHPLIAEVLVTTLSPRRVTHLRRLYFAVWLSARHVPEHIRAAHVALHAEAAGETAQALTWSVRAAAETGRMRGYAEESQHLARACRLWPQVNATAGPQADYVPLLRRATQAAHRAGDYDLALSLGNRAYELAGLDEDPLTTSNLLNELNSLRHLAGDRPPLADFEQAVAVSRVYPTSPEHVRALAELAMQERYHRVEGGRDHADDALRLAGDSGSQEALAHALLATADSRRGTPDSPELAREALALARSTEDVWLASNAALCASRCLLDHGQGLEAVRLLTHVRVELIQAGAPHEAAKMAIAAADLLYWFGGWNQARTMLREAMSVRLPALWARWARLTAAELAARSGHPVPAEQHLHRARELGGDTEEPRNGFISAAADVLMARSEYPAALDLIRTEMAAVARTDPTLADDLMVRAAISVADAHSHPSMRELLGDLETERRSMVPSMFEPTSSHDPVPAAYAALYAAHRSRAGNLEGGDAKLWQVAVLGCDAANMAWDAAQARFRLATALLTQRRSPGNAAAALRQAHGTSIELGADVLRADIEALAMQAHLSLEQPQPEALQENGAPLLADVTRREREVLGHLLAGRTYAEIAQALFISEKTVGAHVSHLLRKTHTSSRIQLAELARKVVPHDA